MTRQFGYRFRGSGVRFSVLKSSGCAILDSETWEKSYFVVVKTWERSPQNDAKTWERSPREGAKTWEKSPGVGAETWERILGIKHISHPYPPGPLLGSRAVGWVPGLGSGALYWGLIRGSGAVVTRGGPWGYWGPRFGSGLGGLAPGQGPVTGS